MGERRESSAGKEMLSACPAPRWPHASCEIALELVGGPEAFLVLAIEAALDLSRQSQELVISVKAGRALRGHCSVMEQQL